MTRPRSFDWERAVAMIEDGYTVEGVCRELGCHPGALWVARRELGSTVRFRRGPVPLDEERVMELTRRGLSLAQIADKLSVTTRTISRARARARR